MTNCYLSPLNDNFNIDCSNYLTSNGEIDFMECTKHELNDYHYNLFKTFLNHIDEVIWLTFNELKLKDQYNTISNGVKALQESFNIQKELNNEQNHLLHKLEQTDKLLVPKVNKIIQATYPFVNAVKELKKGIEHIVIISGKVSSVIEFWEAKLFSFVVCVSSLSLIFLIFMCSIKPAISAFIISILLILFQLDLITVDWHLKILVILCSFSWAFSYSSSNKYTSFRNENLKNILQICDSVMKELENN